MDTHLQDIATPEGRFGCMVLIRRFEEKIADLFSKGLIGGTSHLCIGQEASAVGILSAFRDSDPIVSSHRGHGHFLARGGAPVELMAELLGKRTGPCLGRGGSQHICKKSRAFYGTNGITGGGLPVATGIALAARLRASGQVAVCFFGDGATNQGTFHESLNMASIWDLPIVYVCENNLYAMSTPMAESMRAAKVAERAAPYKIYAFSVDGMDVDAVRHAGQIALTHAAGGSPVLVECLCYRYCGHSKSDRLVYRTREEEAIWRGRDPLLQARGKLRESGVSDSDLDAIEAAAARAVEDAYATAAAAPDPTRDDVIVSPYSGGI